MKLTPLERVAKRDTQLYQVVLRDLGDAGLLDIVNGDVTVSRAVAEAMIFHGPKAARTAAGLPVTS